MPDGDIEALRRHLRVAEHLQGERFVQGVRLHDGGVFAQQHERLIKAVLAHQLLRLGEFLVSLGAHRIAGRGGRRGPGAAEHEGQGVAEHRQARHQLPNVNSMVCRARWATGVPSTIFGRNFQRRIAANAASSKRRGGSASMTLAFDTVPSGRIVTTIVT